MSLHRKMTELLRDEYRFQRDLDESRNRPGPQRNRKPSTDDRAPHDDEPAKEPPP